MLQLEDVGRRYPSGTQALDGICLTLAKGECLAVLGPSGCGKSTLLRLIAGLEAPDAGRLLWHAGAPPAAGRIGMVFQEPTLMAWASALDNAALPLRLARRRDARAVAARNLAEVGLAGFEHARPRSLSGGMRMRVALARALSTDPDLLLMDEPYAVLDEPTRHRLQDELRALHARRACTIVFVTHSVYEAAYVADRVALLSARPGRIAALRRMPPHAGRMDPCYLASVADLSALLA